MKMALDETGREKRTVKIDDFPGLVISKPDYPLVIDSDMGWMNFTAKNVNDPSILKQQLGWFFPASYRKFMLDCSHANVTIPVVI
jgi:hypothetical protein